MTKLLLAVAILASIAWTAEAFFGFTTNSSYLNREPLIFPQRSTRAVELEYIEQLVDNFNPQNTATYQMRYYRNDEFFQEGGPIFIYVGGEWSISPGSLRGGHMYDMAEELNGQMFYTEHRYYGQSFPTPDASTENMQYLSIEQALADLANFIAVTKREPRFQNANVVLVGGSYSATMVAWFRQLYPHLAVGAWASSAPVLAKADFIEYKEVVGAAIHFVGGRQCYQRLGNAFAEAEALISNGEAQRFRELFQFCDDFDAEVDAGPAFSTLTDILAGVVQYHRDGDIEYICNGINNAEGETDLEAYASWFRNYFFGGYPGCIDNYNEFIQYYRNTAWDSGATRGAGRQWFYQTCTEFGWYQTSGSVHQPFGSSFPVELSYQMCSDLYGEQINRQTINLNIDRKNVLYGGFRPEINNVYFTNGLIDPWRTMSIQTDLNPRSPADVIPGASHCADLSSASPNDSVEMAAVKQRIRFLVSLWLGNVPVPI